MFNIPIQPSTRLNMFKIAVCIPTYRRPAMLKQLLVSIFENNVDISLINEMDIIIVDNDKDKSAEPVVNEINRDAGRLRKLLYYSYPLKGLSNVRNELLRQAFHLKPDFIIFIDDDEYVTVDWANELIKSIVRNNADAARGPVFAKLEVNTSKYIARFFRRENYPDNYRIYRLTTGNLILRRESLEKYNLWFDKRFNFTGAEDSYFGVQLIKKGATFYWAAKAIAYETIPERRATLSWLIKRNYNGALNYSYILKLEKKHLSLVKKTLISGAYLLIGSMALLILPFPFLMRYWGILKISEAIGGFAGLFSIHFHEYANDR